MALNPFLDPKNDLAFKRIFGTERNKNILIHFLNDLLTFEKDHEIKDVIFLEAFQETRLATYEQSLIDMLCVDTRGEIYMVKLLIARTSEAFTQRVVYYASKAYRDQFEAKRRPLWRVIILAMTEFIVCHKGKNYRSTHLPFVDIVTNEQFSKDLIFTLLEPPKFTLTIDQLRTMTDRWTYIFKYGHETKREEVEMIAGGHDIIKKAYRRLDRSWWLPKELDDYEQGLEQQRNARAAEEAEQGRREKERIEGRGRGPCDVANRLVE